MSDLTKGQKIAIVFIAIWILATSWSVYRTFALGQENADQSEQIADAAIANRVLGCSIARAITANPIVRVPQFESKEMFRRRVEAMNVILATAEGIDCNTVLGPIIQQVHEHKGGGLQSSPQPGSQLLGATDGPLLTARRPSLRAPRADRRQHRNRLAAEQAARVRAEALGRTIP